MKLTLQFVHRPIIPWGGLGSMVVMCVIAIIFGGEWRSESKHVQAETEQLERLQLELKELKLTQQINANKRTPQEIQRAKEHVKIIDALNYPWNRIFGEIEQTEEPGVAVLAFSHDQASGLSQLTVEALDTPAIIRYAKQLNGEHGDGQWYISNYQVQNQSSPQTVKANLISK